MEKTVQTEAGVGDGRQYDAGYYASHCGVPYTWDNPWWPEFFGRIADAVTRDNAPLSVLDAGCALGFLVAALRDRGVEAYGIDISEFAIEQVPEAVRPYCRVESITTPFTRDYDLIVCIEVLEHLPPEDAEPVISNLCNHAARILFSSTPSDEVEPTHLNVRPASYWAELFARHGFFRDVSFDARVVAPHACMFARRELGLGELAAGYEAAVVDAELRAADLHARASALEEQAARIPALEAAVESLNERAGAAEEQAARIPALEAAVESLSARAGAAEEQAARIPALEAAVSEWQGVRERSGWRIYNALFELRAKAAPPGTLRDRAVRRGLRGVAAFIPRAQPDVADVPVRGPVQKAVLFLSGCPGDAKRYRADHQAEQLGILGVTSDGLLIGEIHFGEILDRYRAIFLHRVAWDRSVERLLEQAAAAGVRVIFDTDDLVFDPNALAHVAALEDMDSAERQLYVAGVGRYRHTLEAVAAATVSTEALAEEARRVVPAVEVSYNAVSAEMVDLAEAARVERSQRVCETVTVAYLSGTPTHNRDFEEAADALVWMLEEFPESRFVAVGHLELDDRFVRFGDRVRHMPLQPWRELPRILADVDVNLAPLEPDNPFTDSKSCLKYIEAGLVGVPTIASPRRDFVRAVRHGDNGLLADSPEEWRTALGSLVASPVLRAELGGRALADVRERHTTAARARALLPIIGGLVRATADEPLAVNWLVRAPIPRTGGYRTIFRLAAFLAEQGHPTQMYVEPIAHLAGFSRRRVEAFLAEHFGHLPFDVHVGHGHIAPADVSFATNWPTAATVAAHQASLFKAYLIQDYEPEFYDVHDPLHEEARRTYELPLRHICYGPHLAQRLEKEAFRPSDALEFALEPEFSLERAPGERPGPPRVLFFAKPDQARRGFGVGVEALRLLHESVPEAEIVLFGGDDDALGELPFPYRNLGSLTTAELAAALNEAHVFLSLSLTNISHAPYEAMACGCAVVEARVAAVEASLRDGENCLLAEPAPVPLAEALVRLVRDDELRVRLAGRANADVAGRTWERTGHELERLLLDWAFVRIDRKAAA